MKSLKRLSALFLSLSLTLCGLPAFASAEDAPTHVYLEGTEIAPGVYEYHDDDGSVITSESWEPQKQMISVTATEWAGEIIMDDQAISVWDEDGKICCPLAYDGSIYIPLSTLELWLGTEIEWFPEVSIAQISTNESFTSYPMQTSPEGTDPTEVATLITATGATQTVECEVCPDILIMYNGEDLPSFENVLGDIVHPLLTNGTVYLPIRGISEFFGKSVSWEQNSTGDYSVFIY